MVELLTQVFYYPLLNLLAFYTWLIPGHNIAWGIILLTLTVRFALLVPSKRQAQSQRKLQQIAPLVEELKKEYGDDKQGMATAQMDLYKKNNINPFGSCGLILIQFPLLILLYNAIIHGIAPGGAHLYSWLPQAASVSSNFFGIDLLHVDTYYVLPIIAATLQFFQLKLVQPKNVASDDPTQNMQKSMMYVLPLVALYVAGRFPAGVALYWVVSTAFTVVQQYYVNKEKFNISGVQKVLEVAEKKHPEGHRSAVIEKEILEETTAKKGNVTVTVRRKK